jgi:SAM-dependent methyltransferase
MREFWEERTHAAGAELSWEAQPILELCGEVSALQVLELGCGSAALGRTLARRGANVTAVDFSPSMIELARGFHGGDLVEFVCADALGLDLGRRFDLIVGVFFLHETPAPDFPRLVSVLDRHLARGGRLVFLENSFFNPLVRFVRRNLVDTGILRKVGSHDETPFDPERFQMLRQAFQDACRRVDRFVFFSRAFAQFVGHRAGFRWSVGFGRRLDELVGRLPPDSRFALAWSYHQFILARRA